jgi:hypothetical protein
MGAGGIKDYIEAWKRAGHLRHITGGVHLVGLEYNAPEEPKRKLLLASKKGRR